MNIWRFSRLVSDRLLRWACLSVITGLVMGQRRDPLWRGIGRQALGWGLIDAAIALIGNITAQNRIASLPNPGETPIQRQEKSNLRTLLWINAVLDVFYVLGGLIFARSDKGDGVRRGHGLGIVLQGGFLLVFDTLHALLIEDVEPR